MELGGESLPSGHTEQRLRPVYGLYCPLTQSKQVSCPLRGLYWPVEHFKQAVKLVEVKTGL